MSARTVGEVIFSKSDKFKVGDQVMGNGGWQKFAVIKDKELNKIPSSIKNIEQFLVLELSGLTAYFGLENIGKIKPG